MAQPQEDIAHEQEGNTSVGNHASLPNERASRQGSLSGSGTPGSRSNLSVNSEQQPLLQYSPGAGKVSSERNMRLRADTGYTSLTSERDGISLESGVDAPGPPDVDEVEPADEYHATYVSFFMLGLGALFPWNVFITATAYYDTRLSDAPTYARIFINTVMFLFQAIAIVTLMVCVKYQHRYSAGLRISGSLCVQLSAFILITVLVVVPCGPETFFFSMLGLAAACAVGTSVLQAAVFGLASQIPQIYTGAVMLGQGLAGMIVAVTGVVTSSGASTSPTHSALYYFAASCTVILICLILSLAVPSLPLVTFYRNKANTSRPPAPTTTSCLDEPNGVEKESEGARGESEEGGLYLARCIWPAMANVVGVFAVTLAVFPVVTSRIQAASAATESTYGRMFVPVYCFVGFNLGDTLGRLLAAHIHIPITRLWLPVVLRIVFVPLFLMCNYTRGNLLPQPFASSDVFPVVFMLLFSVTNGMYATHAMAQGPTLAPLHLRERAGALMALCIPYGLVIGSLLSFIF